MSILLDFTPCPECRTIPDSPVQRGLWPPSAAGVATTAAGDGNVVAAAPADVPPSAAAGAAHLPAYFPGAGPVTVPPQTPRTPRRGGTVTTPITIARACAAWLWTRCRNGLAS